MDGRIFGLRFGANVDLLPAAEEIGSFLGTLKRDDKKARHADDFDKYLSYLKEIEEFQSAGISGAGPVTLEKRMFLGVLSQCRFFHSALKSAVEQFKYHYNSLLQIDFKKSQAFIKVAEEEISALNSKRKEDEQKRARLRNLIDQRVSDIVVLKKLWAATAKELFGIASYARDNIVKIAGLCESSISLLVQLQIAGEKKRELIEDIKTHYREMVRDHLQIGPVTKEFIERLKEDVARLSERLSKLVLEDIYSMTHIFERVYEHTRKTAELLDRHLQGAASKRRQSLEDEQRLLGRIEEVMVSLIKDFEFEIKSSGAATEDAAYDMLLAAKRGDMLNHVFTLLENVR